VCEQKALLLNEAGVRAGHSQKPGKVLQSFMQLQACIKPRPLVMGDHIKRSLTCCLWASSPRSLRVSSVPM